MHRLWPLHVSDGVCMQAVIDNCVIFAQLKLREALMPEVVSQVEALERAASSSNNGNGSSNGSRPARIKSWAASPKLFPCDVSPEAKDLMKEAVSAAKGAWGERQLPELEAEDRLAIACERAPTSDPVIAKLRAAFQVPLLAACIPHTLLPHSLSVNAKGRHVRND